MPTPMFHDGQLGPEIRAKLNELGDLFQAGVDGLLSLQGWSPVFSVVADGSSRQVLRIVDWVGGDGDKPTTLGYVGSGGIVATAASAVNIKGSTGPANSLSIGTVVSGASASATISGTAPAQELNLVLPKGDNGLNGLNGLNGWSPVLAVATDGERRVLEVVDWTGGEGSKPTATGFIGATGIVATAALAVDIRGSIGATGPSNTLTIGTVTGGATASATITGTSPSQVLNLVLPKGDPGTNGTDGLAATIAVGTVTTGAPGTSATVVNSGTSSAAVLNFTIPKGNTGASGAGTGDVVGPAASVDNEVALFDGATGQILKGGGVLNTGAYAEQDRWKLQAFSVMAMTSALGVPSWALGSYYPLSDQVVANGDTAIKGATGDIYTMTDGVWVLTHPIDVNSNGSRIAFAQTGNPGPFLWTRTGGITTRTIMSQGSGNIRYSEGTAGVDFADYTVRGKLNEIGRLINLTTTDKTSIVAAINELVSSKANASSLGTSAALNVPATGDAATGEVVKGNDTRLSDSRTPTGAAGGVLSGSYPNPGFAVDMATQAELDAVSSVANSKLSDAPSDGKTYGRKNAAWAEVVATQQLQRVGVFADGASALTPASSGEVIFDTQVDTGLAANTNGVVFSNSLFIATGPVTGVATAASAAGPWTLRSFAASLGGSNPRIGTDGTNSMVSASGVTAVARSTNGTTWTSATALPGNTAAGAVPVCIGGVWLIAATAATSVYRSNNHGTSWTTESINAPAESTIFRLGTRFCYFNGSAIYHSTLGTTADFAYFSHGLGFTPAQITPLPDGTCAFIDPFTGQVYLATDFNVLTPQTGVFCPLNHRILRINGVWVFVPVNEPSGSVYTASGSGMASRLAASPPYYASLTQPAMPYAVSGGVTVLPRSYNNLGASFNGLVTVVTHSTSRQVYFAGA